MTKYPIILVKPLPISPQGSGLVLSFNFEELIYLKNAYMNGSKGKPNSNPSGKNKPPKALTERWLSDYPPELRGPSQNRYGGHKCILIKGLKGNTFGPAGPCRRCSASERAQVERDLREKGLL
jgi:hypothetical protein